jgi:GNAT superfamily N-acetyltransferase
MEIRDAVARDWAGIWAFMQPIVSAGETYSWDPAISEERARDRWFRWAGSPRGHTVVAAGPDGAILGTAETGPNFEGPAGHIASASFMVDPAHAGQGVGRALGEHVLGLARAGGFRAMQFNAVVETNTRAVELWRSLGFGVLATVPAAFRHPVHGYVGLHIMHRRL